MKYVVLIYNDPRTVAALDARQADTMMEECIAHADAMRQDGHLIEAIKLPAPETATSLRMRNGRLVATDGPFAETKEQLGGFMLIEAKDLNEAIRLASAIPWVRTGCLEVRPLPAFAAFAPHADFSTHAGALP